MDIKGWFPTWSDIKRAPAMSLLEKATFWIFDLILSSVGSFLAWRLGTPSMTGFGVVLLVFISLFIIAPLGVLLFAWLAGRAQASFSSAPRLAVAGASNEDLEMSKGDRSVYVGGPNFGLINTGDTYAAPPQRRLVEGMKQELLGKIPKEKRVNVYFPVNEVEPQRLAQEIAAFLTGEGYAAELAAFMQARADIPKPIEFQVRDQQTDIFVNKQT